MKPFRRTVRSFVVAGCILSLVLSPMLQIAYADEFWEAAKAYSESMGHLVTEAIQLLSDAKDVLEIAEAALFDAKTAIGAAGSAAVVGKAAAAVATAEGAVAAATTALGVATAIVTAWVAGTAAGQAIDYGISQIWDPICPIAITDTVYIYPTDAEVDSWIPGMIFSGTNLNLNRADFNACDAVVPGSGTACWNFMREGGRLFAIAMRGAGAYTAGRCPDVLTAADDIESSIPAFTAAVENFAAFLSTAQTFTGDPMAAINNARFELNALEASQPWSPADVPDPAALINAINMARAALDQAEAALLTVSNGTGNAILIDGEYLPPSTLLGFIQWLDNCRVNGVACLPQTEILVSDYLVATLGVTYAGIPSINAPMAAWDGLGDTANEAALFSANGGVLTKSQVLTTAIDHHWNRIDISYSPLIQCGPARILQDPSNTSATYGGTATFTVRAAGNPTLVYQWNKNGIALVDGPDVSGATASSLTLSNVQLTLGVQDCYNCRVTNLSGSAESACASLTVPCLFDIPGDLNHDCVENLLDFTVFASYWLKDSSTLP